MIYPEKFEQKIGFDRIRQLLADNCLSPMGLERVELIRFNAEASIISSKISATFEFQQLITLEPAFPSDHYYKISDSLNKIRIEGSFPEIEEVFNLRRSLETVNTIVSLFKKKDESTFPVLKSMCSGVKVYPYVLDAADRIIDRHGNIRDNASRRLREIRDEIAGKTSLASKRLNSILKAAQIEGFVDHGTVASIRNGRGVIPVNTWDKKKINGLIHDQSASGKTVYIEPAEIVQLNNEIVELEYEERREIVRILTSFADDIRPYIDDLIQSNDFLGEIDFIRAKALLGNQLGSARPAIADKPGIFWKNAVHPLLFLTFKKLKDRKVVPLDISLDSKNRIILISGPNAGGKSVCLKTVGLLQYMFQCGLTIPVEEGSGSGIFEDIFIDIGDEQSIENDLSTYSSHLINMKYVLRNSSAATLVLIDEFGTGTEPALGGSIAEAILAELIRMEIFGVLTTHYTNLKHFASVTDGIVNGAMLFDNHLMQPLFQLSIGKPGSSFAFEIARRIGLPEQILSKASEKAGIKNINYDRHLRDIARDKRYWENKRQNIRQREKRLEELIEEYEKEISGARNLRKEIVNKAKVEAESMLDASNKLIENTIRQIRESQADREKTKEARQKLEEFRENMAIGIQNSETQSEQEAIGLSEKVKRINPRLSQKKIKIPAKEILPLKPGDPVRVTDTMAVGEVIKIEGKLVQIETGRLRFFVSADKVEVISREQLKKSLVSSQAAYISDPAVEDRKRHFRPEIDIRGVRGEEALNRVRNFLDDALIVQYRNLRILHGKGNGILRQLIREYLSTVDIVKSFRDESVEYGGSGITVIELDL